MYDDKFFEVIREGCRRSANVVVPMLCEILSPSSMVDVGCGEGWWAKAFADQGVDAAGIDGPDTVPVIEAFTPHNIALSLPPVSSVDLALSLEVAEHLPPFRAQGFIDDLCSLAPVVVFSAAIPGQGGTGHINEQWPDYWVEKFENNGFTVSGAFRWSIWGNPEVENWYQQNLLVAAQQPELYPSLFEHPVAEPFAVVNPVLWNARR